LDLVRTGKEPIKFVSSAESDTPGHRGLLKVTYKRVQKESPEFYTVYEGIDQSVDIRISTFIFRAAPEPVLTLYDFIMTTFVPEPSDPPPSTAPSQSQVDRNQEQAQPSQASQTFDKIRVLVKLATVQSLYLSNMRSSRLIS
jgi:vacuolar protein sorting-associated protein 13A/C